MTAIFILKPFIVLNMQRKMLNELFNFEEQLKINSLINYDKHRIYFSKFKRSVKVGITGLYITLDNVKVFNHQIIQAAQIDSEQRNVGLSECIIYVTNSI